MTEAPSNDQLTSCFSEWREALDRGELLSATLIAGNNRGLAAALQRRINDHFDSSADEVDTNDAAQVATDAAIPPTKVPGFTILDKLGSGGMGAVYRVRHDVLEYEWAMKLVRPDRMTKTAKARFVSEAVAMAKLKHPNIISVLDYHESDNGVPYLLMPIYPTSLLQQADRLRKDRRRTVQVLAGIAAGVGYLHERGYLHRDVKPHNVLLTEDDVPIVSDFGLVKDLAKQDSSEGVPSPGETYPVAAGQTHVGSIMGTRGYMAPEQAAGQTQLANPTWDVWSIGVLAHELLTGHFPPSVAAPHHLLDPNKPDNPAPRTFCPTLEPELERILQKCLAREVKDRYPSAVPLANDLNRWLNPPNKKWLRLLTALTALVALLTLAAALWLKKPTPSFDPRDELLATLARDGKAHLIGPDGRPKYSKIVAGQAFASEREWVTDKAYTVESQRGVLVELVPAEAIKHGFRLSGRVRLNDQAGPKGRAGLMFAGRPGESSFGQVHEFLELSATYTYANDLPREERQPNVNRLVKFSSKGWLYNDAPAAPAESTRPTELAGVHQFPENLAHPRGDEAFHQLEVVVTPTLVRKWGHGQELLPTQKLTLDNVFRLHERAIPLRTPYRFDAGGSLGLFIWQASASFQELTVELLHQEHKE